MSLGESWPVFSPAEFILGEHDGVSFFFLKVIAKTVGHTENLWDLHKRFAPVYQSLHDLRCQGTEQDGILSMI